MLATSHVLAGALIGRAVSQNPVAAFGVGVVSHFVMDACPHWGVKDPPGVWSKKFVRVAKCDGCAAMAAMAVGAGLAPARSRRAVIAGMVGAALPDADKPMEYFFGVNPFPKPVQTFHSWVQREAEHRLPHEVASALVLGLALIVTIRIER
jgi:hypothetical protein